VTGAPAPTVRVNDARVTGRWVLVVILPATLAIILAAVFLGPGWPLVAVVVIVAAVLAATAAVGIYRGPTVTREPAGPR
jgi:hypothetical protein